VACVIVAMVWCWCGVFEIEDVTGFGSDDFCEHDSTGTQRHARDSDVLAGNTSKQEMAGTQAQPP
jgi:hypothetical protein